MLSILSKATALAAALKTGLSRTIALSGAVLALAGSAASAATLTNVPTADTGVATIMLRGEIVAGDLGRLQTAVARVRSGQRIALMLESPGGSIQEGIAIGRYIYANRITTIAVQGPGCASSCALLFLAGRDTVGEKTARIMIKGARLGFHQASLGNGSPQLTGSQGLELGQEIVRIVNTYFNDIKADPEFLTLFLSSRSSSLTNISELDALRLGIHVMDPATQRLLSPEGFRQQTSSR